MSPILPVGRLSVTTALHDGVLFEHYRRAPGATERLAVHMHEEYQFSIGLTVSNSYEHRRGLASEPPGQLTVLPPGMPHRPLPPPSNPVEARLLLVYVPARMVHEMSQQVTGRAISEAAEPVVLGTRVADVLQALHRDLGTYSTLLERDARLMVVLAAFTAAEKGASPEPRAGTAPARAVACARAYLHAHAEEEVRLERLAAEAGVSPFHLARSFRAELGVAPHAYQLQLRVGRSKALLANGATPAQAAAQTGFYDQSHLGRHFRVLVGVTPGAYATGARTS